MKTLRNLPGKRGFTLMELMVAMAITTIIVTVLVSITSVALDTWNRSRAELRASRQAKSMIDTMARDFEAMVTRRGNTNEWLSAEATKGSDIPGEKVKSSNSSKLIFFTAVTDRYNGEIGSNFANNVGDVSCVAYELDYKDPVTMSGSGAFKTFVLNRLLVNPDDTFQELLGKDDLPAAFQQYENELTKQENFVCENIYQFTVTFHIQVTKAGISGAAPTIVDVPVTVGDGGTGRVSESFKIMGSGIETEATPAGVSATELAAGRLTAMEISVTVISDFGIDQLRTRTFTGSQQTEFIAKNSYQYTKLVQLSTM